MKVENSCSVVIPVYQAEKWLSATIDSCLNQLECIKEVILIDDFSTDESWNVIVGYQRQYPMIIKGYKNFSKGSNNARNYGLSLSTGKYIQWLDADDVILPNKLNSQINFLNGHPEIDIAYSGWRLVELIDSVNIYSQLNQSVHYQDYLNELLKNNWLPPHAYLLRRDIAVKAAEMKGWNPITSVSQDREYFTKAAIIGAKFGYVPGIFCIYYRRFSESSVSRNIDEESRAKELVRLLTSFYEEMQLQQWIKESDKKKYNKILLSQIFKYSMLYDIPFCIHETEITNPDWSSIKGIKSKFEEFDSIMNNF